MKKKEKYDYYFQLFIHESKLPWEISQLFLTSNTIFLAITGVVLTSSYSHITPIFSTVGLLITILWYLSYNRTVKVDKLRKALLRNIEPTKSDILDGIPWLLSNGKEKKINHEVYDFKVLGYNIKTTHIFNMVIFIFVFIYLFLFLYSISLLCSNL